MKHLIKPVRIITAPCGIILSALILLSISSCSNKMSEEQKRAHAKEVAQQVIIIDGHIDYPYKHRAKAIKSDISTSAEGYDFDYEKAKEGGLDAPFMSIYIPARYQVTGGAKDLADTLINMIEMLTTTYDDKFAPALSPGDILQNFEKGLISLPLGMENGAPIEGDLDNVDYFHQRGIRYITLTHSKDNEISDSSYDTVHTHGGLSAFGEKVVERMNQVGIMIDVSHLSDDAFYDVMRVSTAPVIASHSSCRHFTPGWERNMGDEMIKLLAENEGVIQINFGSSFLDTAYRISRDDIESRMPELLKEKGIKAETPEAKEFEKAYKKEHLTLSTVQRVAEHIDHVVKLVGIDHVGLGSDFDGVGETLPEGLKDASQYPNLIYELIYNKGYTMEDIEKICYKNVMRVWNEVDKVASQN